MQQFLKVVATAKHKHLEFSLMIIEDLLYTNNIIYLLHIRIYLHRNLNLISYR